MVKERDIGRNRFLNPLGIKIRARCFEAVEKFQCIFTSGSLWNAKSRDEDQDSETRITTFKAGPALKKKSLWFGLRFSWGSNQKAPRAGVTKTGFEATPQGDKENQLKTSDSFASLLQVSTQETS